MKYVLWDWNGTLLDDTKAAIDTLNIQLRARGVREISAEFYRAHFAFPVRPFYELIGMGPTDANWDALAREYHAIYAAQPKGLNAEAVAALEAVRAAGAGQSVVSALRQDLLDEAMRTYGLTGYFEHVYGVDNLDGASKLDRARELVGRLVAEGRCRREDIVMIGDALHDKEVADALGVGCVLCAQGGHSYERLVRVAPTGRTLLAALAISSGLRYNLPRMKTWLAFWYGIIKNNPTFRLVLGLCPTLAVTTSLENALGMGMAATFVLICSNGLVSALRKVIPAAVHIPCYIVIIATFVTAIDLLMQAYLPSLSASLGIFIPLIVVNCIILGRAEAYACKNSVIDSLADGIGSGVGFTLALAMIAAVREIVGAGTLTVWGDLAFKNLNPGPVTMAILPAGGFITLGLLLALINRIGEWNARRHGAPAPLPVNLDCRHCTMCPNGKG